MSQDQEIPSNYVSYYSKIRSLMGVAYATSTAVRQYGFDPSKSVESPVAIDLPDRVAKLLDIPIDNRLRSLLDGQRTEEVALVVAQEVASGKYPIPEGVNVAEAAVRIGLAIVTDGVTVAPIQGISAVRIKENSSNSQYLSVEFAGPIRSAGGTESALTLIIADQVRKVLGLEEYNATAIDDEPGRFIEELRIYERDVGNFQYKVSDEDIRKAIGNLPVEVDGVWTDNYEVSVHRDMKRISTNRLRGGALRVVNDGVIGKSKKLVKLLGELGVEGWNWLSELSGGRQQGSEETKATSSHFGDVISGRPVLSMPGIRGGFRLRYGRSMNTGIHAIGIHPSVSILLQFPVVTGTQIKVDVPGKAASIAFVDSIDTPTIKLKDGSVVKIRDAEHASLLSNQLDSILYLGDILISYGDFLENNTKLLPSAYVEEWWVNDLEEAIQRRYTNLNSAGNEIGISPERLQNFLRIPVKHIPSLMEAEKISKTVGIPLHPKYLLYWDQLQPNEVIELRESIQRSLKQSRSVTVPISLKGILEILGVEHHIHNNEIVIEEEQGTVIIKSLGLDTPHRLLNEETNWGSSLDLVTELSGLQIKQKSSSFIGVRVGRPEKAMLRHMKPPVHGLFPVGRNEGTLRDIISAANHETLDIELANFECPECGVRTFSSDCPYCKVATRLFTLCISCGNKSFDSKLKRCEKCNGPLKRSSLFPYPLKTSLKTASLRVEYNPTKPLKGVIGLSNELKIPERLEKVILRQKHNLSVYRDGTIRYDLTNVPLTHFRPRDIHTGVDTLRELGYRYDVSGNLLEDEDQLLEMFSQDIVIPYEAGEFLLSVSKYIDDLLIHHYGQEKPFYGLDNTSQIKGQLVVGLAPHTSVGLVGRVIGYTNAQGCFATPYWHSAKRRDCDGDGDSIILLMDVLLNFSKSYLPSIIGGLMDAPLLIQPFIIPREVQRQAHHMDVISRYPREFYEGAARGESPSILEKKMDIVKHRLGTKEQFQNFGFTHDTNNITVRQSRSSYSTLKTLNEKLDRQIEIAEKIKCVNPSEVVKSVLRTHLLPDIIGNTKAYTSQSVRCKKCAAKFRRIPLKGVCLNCGGELQPSVTRGSVEKYLQLGLRLSQKYDVGDYLRSRFVMASEELSTLFRAETQQSDIKDYFYLDRTGANQESERTADLAKEIPIQKSSNETIQRTNTKTREDEQTTLF